MGLIEQAFLLLVQKSLPVYRHNIDRLRPPVAQGEYLPATGAIMMLLTAIDYHLCRLKYLRDVATHKPPLPYTPYFNNWNFGDDLATKLRQLLISPKETRLLTQLIEMTVCRDAIVHPKFYTITHSWGDDFRDSTVRAKLPVGVTHRDKTIKNKSQRGEFSKLLKLPLVPTWISYVDAVVCVLVLHRLLGLLEWRYGNPYAWVGGITAYENETKNLFAAWNWQQSHPQELEVWANAFFHSLSDTDQVKVEKRLGGNVKLYVQKKRRKRSGKKISKLLSLARIFQGKSPRKPDFLSKPPPKRGVPI
jgi:hypothetical protein